MSELGIGVRVFVGYAYKCGKGSEHYMCNVATVYNGPFPPEDHIGDYMDGVWWKVKFDDGQIGDAVESILFPIDDWDEEVTTENTLEAV